MDSSELFDSLSNGSWDHLAREDLEELAASLIELDSRKKDFPLYYFEPNPKLVRWDDEANRVAAAWYDGLISMLAGGNRSGKTEHLVNEGCCNAIGYRPWVLRKMGLPAPSNPCTRPENLPQEALCFDASGIRVRTPGTVLLGTGLDLKKGVGETLHPKVEAFLGREGGPFIKKIYWAAAGTPHSVILHNGTRILYASAAQKGLSWESTNHTWYGLDEPIPKKVYTGVRRGAIDQSARICFSFTPLGPNAAWMFRDLYKIGAASEGNKIRVSTISIFDNPWLPPKAVEEFARDPSISDVEKESRLYGKFQHLIDRIYGTFTEETHVIPAMLPDPSWFVGHVIDPHTVKPWAMAWFTVTPSGDIIFFREWPTTDFTKLRRDTRSPQQYANLIREIEGNRPADYRLIDPNYGGRQDVMRGVHIPSVCDTLSEYGIHTNSKINDNIQYGESRVRSLLSYDTKQDVSDVNHPRLYVTENCFNVINAFLYYIALNKSAEDDMPDEDKRDEEYKDFADLVRYAAVSRAAEHSLTDAWLEENMFDPFNDNDPYPTEGGYGE